jgi:hypothetical protein|tara:strand:- start:165 stop:320 length:156 start_codon:yes stop_codon:yes gene_type:complete
MQRFRVFLLAVTATVLITSCGGDTTATTAAASAPANGYVTPAGINSVPIQD